jgi:FkbM family methyltransferase
MSEIANTEIIPIIIICYNNYKYVKNILNQIRRINIEYYKNIQILDNVSTCIDTINFLKNIDCEVIYNTSNNGPWITPYNNSHIYNILPNKFILTDPDLELNKDIPTNFIDIMSNLSDKYNCSKIGFALDIDDFIDMYQLPYVGNNNIYEHEIIFWQKPIIDDLHNLLLYDADIDTTFCLINKQGNASKIRIASSFTAKHIPWYIDNKIYSVYENYELNKNTTAISTISKIIIPYIENNYIKINKNNEYLLILNDINNINLNFWKNTYSHWESTTFDIFDQFLTSDKIFIDIGGWIGTTCIYGSRKSKHVYVVEADQLSIIDMKKNIYINNINNNITLIKNAIYNVDNLDIMFGNNQFLNESKLNDSTSHLILDSSLANTNTYLVKTITIQKIIEKYNIDLFNISLIKIDIEGGEEHILNDLFFLKKEYNIPLYISFHYDWWLDKNLERFTFLTGDHINSIKNNPFISIIF